MHRISITAIVFGVIAIHAILLLPSASAQTGLVAAYSFNEGTGTSVADVSSNHITGTVVNGTWVTGKYGNGLSFNGVSSYVDLGNPTALRLTGSMTWSAWIYATANPADDGQIIAKSNESGGWQLKTSPDTGPHTFGVAVSPNGTSHVQRYSNAARALNTWYFVAGVYNASAGTLDIYVNGVLANGSLSGAVPASQFNSSVNVNIGRRTGGFYFNGLIDEVRIYNRALTQAEIQTDMNTPIGVTGPDTQPPTAPASLTATAAGTAQINLSWPASTDNIAVTGYRVERCQNAGCSTFAQIATPTATTYSDTGLTAGTSYSYRVRATDAAGNLGGYSPTATAVTQAADTQPPTAPASLTATAAGTAQINLSWPASTDNIAVTGYRVERCQNAGCSTFAQIATPTATTYSDTGLTAGTSYSYRVRATDAAGNLGGYSPTATAVTQAADTQPPTAPASLTATAAGTAQINLSWPASTDNIAVTGYRVERCQNAGCSTFAQIATPTATTYSDTGLTAGTSYSYRVRATDAAGNLGGYSPTATAVTQAADTQPPTAPASLTATAAGTAQINLSWPASTDNIAVTGYRVERCQNAGCSTFAQIATPTATTYSDTGLTAGTSYSYRVRATDAAGNLGGYSPTATAVTQAADTQPPTAPASLTATAGGAGQINLSWPAATDNIGVTGYSVERCQNTGCTTFAQIATPTATTYGDTGLAAATTYAYRVRATDAAGNLGGYSPTAEATTVATISGLVAAYSFNEGSGTAVSDSSGQNNTGTVSNTTWSAAGKFGAGLAFNGTTSLVTIPDSASLHLTGGMTLEAWVNPSTTTAAWRDVIYKANDNYYLEGTSNNGSLPAGGGTFGAATAEVYGTAALAANTWSHLAVTYDGATLRLYVNGTQVSSAAHTGNLATSANPLQIGGDSLWGQHFAGGIDEVRVYNVALTAAQVQADMNTPIAPDTTPPTAPATISATALNGNQIGLTWAAATDNIGVTGYILERCVGADCSNFAQSATPSGTSFTDSNLLPGTSYSYRVRATDAAGNLGSYSIVASAVTLAADTQPPTVPTNLTATAVGGDRIDLSWTASIDNVGVTGYLVERCQGTGCSNFSRLLTVSTITFSDTGLTPNTSYTYHVKATDAAGNFSDYSNLATTTTATTIPGLVSAYSFNEGAGTTLGDSSGNGNTGTMVNATWSASGKFGAAGVFNGTNALVRIADAAMLHLTSAMTLEAWVNPSTVTSAWRDVIYKPNDNYFLEATSNNGSVPAGGGTFGTATTQAYGAAALTPNTWSHLAMTYDGSTVRLYVNGTQTGSLTQAGALATSTNPLQIGGDSTYGQYFSGMIDEVRVYNIALTAAQIQTDMGSPIVSGPTPVFTISSTSINFGNQATRSSSAAQPLTVTNAGTASLNISSITLGGANPGDFAQTNNCTAAIAPNGTCSINVTFTPTTTGSRIATITVSDNTLNTPHTISLSGTGTGFSVTPRITALTFTRTQQFTASSPGVTWKVDGVLGGTAAAGTITTAGAYVPPAAVGSHIITATTSDSSQSADATVYIVNMPGVFTYHNDNFRTGQNASEAVLTPANVNQSQFGKLFSYATDGISYGSPLYVANVSIPGQGNHNVVYVTTEHDSVYAFDADGLSTNPLWKVSFLGTGVTTVPPADTGECCDIPTEIGITSTPTIDVATGTLYIVAKTKEASGGTHYVQRLHALDITTGAEKFGGPVVLQATVNGTGDGSVSGRVSFDPLHENQRPALLLSNGVVYVAFGSHGDIHPWHGWLFGYNATTLQQTLVYCVTPSGFGGGIWQSGAGLSADASGNLYLTSSNGTFNLNSGGLDAGDTIEKFSPSGTLIDYFTPHTQAAMELNNLELGASGPVLVIDQPGAQFPHLLVAGGKEGTIYVINRDNMGHYNPNNDNQAVQSLVSILPNGAQDTGNFSVPVYFNGYFYFAAINDTLKAFQMTNGLLSPGPVSQSSVTYPNRGGSFSVSANDTSNGILWAVQDNTPAAGVLRAYNTSNVAIELYNSSQAGPRDALGVAAKFNVPVVANGRVYVVTSNQLVVYGLLP